MESLDGRMLYIFLQFPYTNKNILNWFPGEGYKLFIKFMRNIINFISLYHHCFCQLCNYVKYWLKPKVPRWSQLARPFSNISMNVKVNTYAALRTSVPKPSGELRDVCCYLGFHAHALGTHHSNNHKIYNWCAKTYSILRLVTGPWHFEKREIKIGS